MSVMLPQFLAVILTALALAPAGAHLFALPNKINLPEGPYYTVQGIYRGWSLHGFALGAAILANLTTAIAVRRQSAPFLLALGASLCMAIALLVFFLWTFPANQATLNWTAAPDNWTDLRRQWEYSHAINAILIFAALVLVTLSVLSFRR